MSLHEMLARVVAGASILFLTAPVQAAPITLEEALQRATTRPVVGVAGASVEIARHEAANASLPANNPEVSAAVGPRFVGGEQTIQFQLGIGQIFQLGGKRAARRAVADARIAAAEAELSGAALDARVETWRTFQLALIAQDRVVAAREGEQVAIQVDTATRERQNVGFGTQLEVNLTTAEVGRARHDRLDAERRHTAALAALAASIGAPARETPEPTGALVLPPELDTNVDELVARALRNRPDARSALADVRLASAELRAANANAVPDLSLGVSYQYERDPGETAQAVLATATIGIPLLNRNQGQRRAARVGVKRAELEQRWTTTQIEREIRVALSAYQRAREAVLGFNREVNEKLHDNLELARASYTSGKIDYFQFNVVRRELLASRAAYLDAYEELVEAWTAVQQATGGEVLR